MYSTGGRQTRITDNRSLMRAVYHAMPHPLILGAVIGALGFAGPFGTYDDLILPARMAYWALAILGGGVFLNAAALLTLQGRWLIRYPRVLRLLAASCLAGVPGAIFVLLLEWAFRGYSFSPAFLAWLWVCVGIFGGAAVIMQYRRPGPFEASDAGTTPWVPLFDRLPPALGTRLVSLSMDDHYVEVTTRKGTHRLKMRFADALAEIDGYPGLRLHRSHWVSLDAVEGTERRGRNRLVRVCDGRCLPVARANVATVEAAIGSHAETAPPPAQAE